MQLGDVLKEVLNAVVSETEELLEKFEAELASLRNLENYPFITQATDSKELAAEDTKEYNIL